MLQKIYVLQSGRKSLGTYGFSMRLNNIYREMPLTTTILQQSKRAFNDHNDKYQKWLFLITSLVCKK